MKLLRLRIRNACRIAIAIATTICGASSAMAQDGSLIPQGGPMAPRQVLTLENGSLIYMPPPPVKQLKLHDIVTVVVDVKSRVLSEGDAEVRKRANYTLGLIDWIQFDGNSITPDPQAGGDPGISTQLDALTRANSDLETRNSMTFTIAATVIDVLPNGNLVIGARREVNNNEEVWESAMNGIIRREDVRPDNTVLSENIAEMQVTRREKGAVRDGYKRGWFTRWWDKYQPF